MAGGVAKCNLTITTAFRYCAAGLGCVPGGHGGWSDTKVESSEYEGADTM